MNAGTSGTIAVVSGFATGFVVGNFTISKPIYESKRHSAERKELRQTAQTIGAIGTIGGFGMLIGATRAADSGMRGLAIGLAGVGAAVLGVGVLGMFEGKE